MKNLDIQFIKPPVVQRGRAMKYSEIYKAIARIITDKDKMAIKITCDNLAQARSLFILVGQKYPSLRRKVTTRDNTLLVWRTE